MMLLLSLLLLLVPAYHERDAGHLDPECPDRFFGKHRCMVGDAIQLILGWQSKS